MAKYDDYAKSAIQDEIDDAGEASRQRERDAATGRFIPDRFKGKDITDVIQSYEELERMNSRQAQDLGNMRRTVDQLLALQSQQASGPAREETATPLTVDEVFENPDAALRRVAKEVTSDEITDLKKEVGQLRQERRVNKLNTDYPDWTTNVQSPEFAEWVQKSPYRQRLAGSANQGDFDAAEEILGMYYETLNRQDKATEREVEKEVQRRQALRDAQLESSGPVAPDLEKTFSRLELMEKRLAAKRGDLKAERWLESNGPAIHTAYAEGRIVD